MSDPQSSHPQSGEPEPAEAEKTNPGEHKSSPGDYYDDDSTGYELYEDPDEEDETLDS